MTDKELKAKEAIEEIIKYKRMGTATFTKEEGFDALQVALGLFDKCEAQQKRIEELEKGMMTEEEIYDLILHSEFGHIAHRCFMANFERTTEARKKLAKALSGKIAKREERSI